MGAGAGPLTHRLSVPQLRCIGPEWIVALLVCCRMPPLVLTPKHAARRSLVSNPKPFCTLPTSIQTLNPAACCPPLCCIAHKAAYLALARQRPDIILELGLSLSAAMSSRASVAEAALVDHAARERALAPYRVLAPKRGVIGSSRYAERLRKQLVAAARDPNKCVHVTWGFKLRVTGFSCVGGLWVGLVRHKWLEQWWRAWRARSLTSMPATVALLLVVASPGNILCWLRSYLILRHVYCSWLCRGSVLVFGEPGLAKDNMAALVHFGSPDRDKPMAQVRVGTCGSIQGARRCEAAWQTPTAHVRLED